jgi:transcriptional regulator with GAF, ATPase, and Fis domain
MESPSQSETTRDTSLALALDEYERRMIQRAITSARGNIAEAARRLQTDRPNLYRRMRRLGIGGQPTEATTAEEAR